MNQDEVAFDQSGSDKHTHFIWGRIAVQLTSCFRFQLLWTTALLVWSNPNQSKRRSTVQWNFPLWNKLEFSWWDVQCNIRWCYFRFSKIIFQTKNAEFDIFRYKPTSGPIWISRFYPLEILSTIDSIHYRFYPL